MNIEIKFTCDKCDKLFDKIDSNVYCDECNSNCDEYAYQTIKSAVKKAYDDHKYVWEDKEGYDGFESEKERDFYLRGVERGYLCALFWVSDYMGDEGIEFFEELAKDDWK